MDHFQGRHFLVSFNIVSLKERWCSSNLQDILNLNILKVCYIWFCLNESRWRTSGSLIECSNVFYFCSTRKTLLLVVKLISFPDSSFNIFETKTFSLHSTKFNEWSLMQSSSEIVMLCFRGSTWTVFSCKWWLEIQTILQYFEKKIVCFSKIFEWKTERVIFVKKCFDTFLIEYIKRNSGRYRE